MNRITPGDLKRLASVVADPCVSIAMPLHRARPDSQQDPIRFRNLLDAAESRLVNNGRKAADARNLLQPARDLQANGSFWRPSEADGLVVLLAPDMFQTLRLAERLSETMMVGNRFLLAPLIRSCRDEEDFYLLALSGAAVRLFLSSAEGARTLPLPEGMPTSMEQALAGTELEKSLQSHAGSITGRGGRGDMIMHGQGTPKDDAKQLIAEYFRIVCKHLEPVLNEEPRPLILAAVDYCHPIFRRVCKYSQLLEQGVTGSPDELSDKKLFERARLAAEPILHRGRKRALQRCRESVGTDGAASDIASILPAAEQGRIDTLLQRDGAHVWGQFDPGTATAIVHDSEQQGDEDLLNLAAATTLARGGRAYVYSPGELPADQPAVALFRW